MHVAGWPANARALRIAFLSDTHPSWPGNSLARLRETVMRINAAAPDVVMLAGDYRFDGAALDRPAADAAIAPLAKLVAPRFAVLGNHDYRDRAAVVTALRRAGVRLLSNDAVRFGPLAVIGVDDPVTRHDRIGRALDRWHRIGGVPVLLAHLASTVLARPPMAMLALTGHTHCGQISLPLLGPPAIPTLADRRYACGVVRDGPRTILIGAGLGTSIMPLRLGVPPEYWLVTIGR
jgi:hypothetical protein